MPAPVSTAPRRSRLLRRLAAVALGLAAGLLAAEGAARWRFGVPLAERTPILEVEAHPTRGFAMVASQAHYTYLHATRTNSLGLRDRELGPKDPTRPRVLLLGDSLVYGQGVADEHTVSRLLEVAMAQRGRPIEAVNGGLRAYSTHQELALLEELGPAIAPDVVLLCWYWNDIQERDVAATYAQLTRSGPVPFDTGAPMRGAVWWRWQGLQVLRASALVMEYHDRRKALAARPPPAHEVEAAMERLVGYYGRFQAWCANHGASGAVAILPEARLALGEAHPAAGLQQRALELALAGGLFAADLTPAIREATARLGRLPVLAYDGHYDPDGNRALAEALADLVEPLLGSR